MAALARPPFEPLAFRMKGRSDRFVGAKHMLAFTVSSGVSLERRKPRFGPRLFVFARTQLNQSSRRFPNNHFPEKRFLPFKKTPAENVEIRKCVLSRAL